MCLLCALDANEEHLCQIRLKFQFAGLEQHESLGSSQELPRYVNSPSYIHLNDLRKFGQLQHID